MKYARASLALCLLCLLQPARAGVSVLDAENNRVELMHAAQRIVTLAPHATELAFAAGVGERLVGTVDYSDYPPAAQRIPRVGSYVGSSLEAILRVRPDLVIAWKDGGSPQFLQRLRSLGVAVYISHPTRLDDVPREILALGHLGGTDAVAARSAGAYRQKLARLSSRYARQPPVSVFYQISASPIFTVSNSSFISSILTLCGGKNVFGGLPVPAPQVSREAVIAARPQVMLAENHGMLAQWDRWQTLPAVLHGTRYTVNADLISRPGPRLVDGAEAICATLEGARYALGLTPR
jgi:ABC-type Fe3+-hydroxamate transport system substrate-binding protein